MVKGSPDDHSKITIGRIPGRGWCGVLSGPYGREVQAEHGTRQVELPLPASATRDQVRAFAEREMAGICEVVMM